MEMCKSKKKLAPLLFLAILLITSSEMVVKVGAKLVCETYWPPCTPKCTKTGRCMRCCKYWGFVHGRCNLKHGMGCYCCKYSDPSHAALRRRHQQQQKMVAPSPLDHLLHA